MDAVGFHTHDHGSCISDAVAQAQAICDEKGLKFTPVRKRALEILLEEHRALGAYDLLKRLAEDGHGSQPPVAYRALDFLTQNGFAHKIEKLNAFIACVHTADGHSPVFLICDSCETVAEATVTAPIWQDLSVQTGFAVKDTIIEAQGTCQNCQEKGTA